MRAAHIVAIGARTPLGLHAEASAAAVRAGICRFQAAADGDDGSVCVDGRLAAAVVGVDRMIALGCSALGEVLGRLVEHGCPRTPIPVLVGLPEERPGWDGPAMARLTAALATSAVPGCTLAIEALPLGHAAALEATRRACERLAEGRCELVIVGGVDSYHHPETLAWLLEGRQWLRSDVRAGFIPGEGAGFVALAGFGGSRSLPSRGVVHAVASAREARPESDEDVSLGEGLTAAVSQMVGAAAPGGPRVGRIYCDLNGERHRSEEWGFVALRLGAAFVDVTDLHTAAGLWGDVGAATGALNLVQAVWAWAREPGVGELAAVWGSSEGGLRAAALVGAPPRIVGGAWGR